MTPTRSSPALDGAFDEFLFASVGEEHNGMPLSVLSALSRLHIDPWADADRLARLPKASAIAALGQSIALLPLGKWQLSDATAIATRLVELLPKPGAKPQAAAAAAATPKPTNWKRTATLALAGLAFGLALYLLLGLVTRAEHRAADGGVVGVHDEGDRRNSP